MDRGTGRAATVPLSVIILLVVVLVIDVFAPRRLTGQVTVEVAAGARYSTALVRDSIVTRFDVGPALAPMVAVTLATALERGWGAQATLDFSTSGLRRHDADGSSVALGRVSTAAFIVGLERRLSASFAARIGVGGLKYLPGGNSGIFRLGSGPITGLGTMSLGYTPPHSARYGLAVEARYDVHGFATPALREEGFGAARTVHRVALTIRAGRGGR